MRFLKKKATVILLGLFLCCALTVWVGLRQGKQDANLDRENAVGPDGVGADGDMEKSVTFDANTLDILTTELLKRLKKDLHTKQVQNHVDNKHLELSDSLVSTAKEKNTETLHNNYKTKKSFVDVEKQANPTEKVFEKTLTPQTAEAVASFISNVEDKKISSVGNIKKPRRNIIIIAHGRSGSTIIGDIFNRHRSVFYLFEPLQMVGRIADKIGDEYDRVMNDILTNILRCRFSDQVVKDIEAYYKRYPNASIALGTLSKSLCPVNNNDKKWDPKLCTRLTREKLETVCRENYEVTVIKILFHRISQESIENILVACAPKDIDCKIIFLARDQRAIIASARSTGFFANTEDGLRDFSNKTCHITKKNILFVKKLHPSVRNKMMVIRYEDFAMDPLNALEKLYQFAALTSKESIRTWLYKRTHPNENSIKECNNVHPVFCTFDDAVQAVNRWRVKVALHDITRMEEYCQYAMMLLGYKPIQGSLELMHNITIQLFTENFVAKKWFLN